MSFLHRGFFLLQYNQCMNKYSDNLRTIEMNDVLTSTDHTILDEQTAARLAELFRAFSDPSRIRIISALAAEELNVGTLADSVGLSESAVSHQLRVLRQMHLVRVRKEGRQVFYALDDEHVSDLYRRGLDHVLYG
jgi:DNA-binding transcriptional ArsR family regulator